MRASEHAMLALIVDDDQAIRCLAAWAGLAPLVEQINDTSIVEAIASMTNSSLNATEKALHKLKAAHCIVDGGITDLADKFLQAHVQLKMKGKR